MFDAIKYGTEVYRNELAKQLLELGYEIERRRNGLEIKGSSDAY